MMNGLTLFKRRWWVAFPVTSEGGELVAREGTLAVEDKTYVMWQI